MVRSVASWVGRIRRASMGAVQELFAQSRAVIQEYDSRRRSAARPPVTTGQVSEQFMFKAWLTTSGLKP
jgi:hypothetical protein